jgi:cell division protein FtsL
VSLLARAQAFVVSLPDRPLLDRIVRGRAWIPILGVLLAGIVAMQVEVLKLNASMGRSLERGTALASRNQQLRASVSALSDDARIERLAAQQGMVMPAPEAVTFLNSADGALAARAAHSIHSPDSPGLIAALPSVDTPGGAAAGTTSAGTTSVGTTAVGTTSAGTAVTPSAGTQTTPSAGTQTTPSTGTPTTTTPITPTTAATATPVAPTTTSPATATTGPSTGG